MRRTLTLCAAIALACGLGLSARPAAAQALVQVNGTILDTNGKPFEGATIVLTSPDGKTEYTAKVPSTGRYEVNDVKPGQYQITIKDPNGAAIFATRAEIRSGGVNTLDLNLKELITPEELAARKKQQEEAQNFEKMKDAFNQGQAKVEEADKARSEMQKAPAAERAGMQPKVNGLYEEALHSFQTAQQVAPTKDPNLHLVYEKLGYANEMLGHYDEAVSDYQKAVELKPTLPEYFNTLSVGLAKAGKPEEAGQACEKAQALDQSKGSNCWLNLGIVLYNKYQLPQAVTPLQKATSLNPKNPQAWYLLGASLVATMTTKQEGEKLVPVLAPGTVEAYQKCIDLDPNGQWGAQAKAGLEQLKAMGAGVDTKIRVKKGKG